MKKVDFSTFERISSNMAKEYGTIKKGTEESYGFCLYPIERNLLKINRKHKINNGRRAIEAIKLSLFIIGGYINGTEYNLGGFIDDENKAYLDGVLMGVDPFSNVELNGILSEIYDLKSTDDLRKYFSLPIKCLLRIEQSMQLWTKNGGVTGYFDFLENTLGHTVSNDDKMDFIIEVSESQHKKLADSTTRKLEG